jgi:DNA polymerase III epsilon subunit-like protein
MRRCRMKFAVIDVETTYTNEIMTVGLVISDDSDFEVQEMFYWVVNNSQLGVFSSQISHPRLKNYPKMYNKGEMASVEEFESSLLEVLKGQGIDYIFAYNASFDKRLLPSLGNFKWVDIMSRASNINTNKYIPKGLEYHKTGRLKKGFGVEMIYRYVTGDMEYEETHNAVLDCLDELQILKALNYPTQGWELLKGK